MQLANAYFDAERWNDAISVVRAHREARSDERDANTDLGVSYYYVNRADEALAPSSSRSSMDPKHTKTLLNKGIVLAFGKEDLQGAAAEWKKVVELAPDSPRARRRAGRSRAWPRRHARPGRPSRGRA